MDHSRHNFTDPWDDGVYGTGRTQPPKNNSGIVAFLMIVIIFLSGIVSGLSFLNIRLFHQLQQVQQVQETVPMAFADLEKDGVLGENSFQEAMAEADPVSIPELGISGAYVSPFDQHYFSWPPGLLISQVEENSYAHHMGMEPGDILLQINDCPITNQQELEAYLQKNKDFGKIQIRIFREGTEYILNGS